MTQEQEALLKIAYDAGCEIARQELEKAAQSPQAIPAPDIQTRVPAGARRPQARRRGENPRLQKALSRASGGPRPKTTPRRRGPGMAWAPRRAAR